MTLHLSAVTCLVRDYDEALRFFRDDLGFEVVEDTPLEAGKRWVVVAPDAGGTALRLAAATSPEELAQVGAQAGGRVPFFLETDDFKGDYYRLVSRGVRFVEAPRDESYGTVAVFADIYGNRWDLVQPGASEAASLEKQGELPVAAVRGDDEDDADVLPADIPVTMLSAGPMLRLMLALEGMEPPKLDPMRSWTVFQRFAALPAQATQDVATFQVTWVTEIDGPPILFCVLARQLTESVRGMAETTRSIQVEFSFEAESDELEDIEVWSDEFESLDAFVAHVEELPHFEIMAREKPVLCNVSEEMNAQT